MSFDFSFKPAVRQEVALRLLLMGPSGSGKTMTGLAVGHHILREFGHEGEKIAVIDSEVTGAGDKAQGSARKYANEQCPCRECRGHGVRFKFDTLELPAGQQSPDNYAKALHAAAAHGYKVVVIDSLTHGWKALLDYVSQLKSAQPRNDPWLLATPMYDKWIEAVLTYPGHVIATCRTKEKLNYDDKKRTSLGQQPEMRSGIEYEFDVAGFVNDASCTVVKTRANALRNNMYHEPGGLLAQHLHSWAVEGNEPGSEEEAPEDKRQRRMVQPGEAARRAPHPDPRADPPEDQQPDVLDPAQRPDPTPPPQPTSAPPKTSPGSTTAATQETPQPTSPDPVQQHSNAQSEPLDEAPGEESLEDEIVGLIPSLTPKDKATAKAFLVKADGDESKLVKLLAWAQRAKAAAIAEAANARPEGPAADEVNTAAAGGRAARSRGFDAPQRG